MSFKNAQNRFQFFYVKLEFVAGFKATSLRQRHKDHEQHIALKKMATMRETY